MKHLVVIPCWNRPGFLQVCLDYIAAADGFKQHQYLFTIDRGNSHIYRNVIRPWERKHKIKAGVQLLPYHKHTGNVYNFMNAFKTAKEHKWDLLHVIEDDVFIAKDYFQWHEQAWQHANFGTFAVSACRNQNLAHPNQDVATFDYPIESFIYRHASYQSLGVSMCRLSVIKICEHAKPDYWTNPVAYLRTAFPGSSIPAGIAEQAGLLHRILLRDEQHSIYPLMHPRAYHGGFAGRNRPAAKPASQYSAEDIVRMTQEQMNKEAKRHKDIMQCDLKGYGCDNLIMIEG